MKISSLSPLVENIQIFGKSKYFDTKKAQRYFKERGIEFQFIKIDRYGISNGKKATVRYCSDVWGG